MQLEAHEVETLIELIEDRLSEISTHKFTEPYHEEQDELRSIRHKLEEGKAS